MKLIDERGKLFGVINLLDILLIIAVVAIGFLGYKYVSGRAIDGDKRDIYFTVELNSVKEDFTKKINIGDEIKDSVKGYYLGVVNSVEVKPDMVINWDTENTRFIRTEVPDSYTVLVEIKSNGTIAKDEVFAETVPVRIGKEMSIKGKGYANTGYIVGLRNVD